MKLFSNDELCHRFRDRDRLDPEGGLFLRDAPEMLAAGQWVARVPNKPGMRRSSFSWMINSNHNIITW